MGNCLKSARVRHHVFQSLLHCLLLILISFPAFASDGDARRGGEYYRACVGCHTLQPDLHISGPSLSGVWGRTAGNAKNYVRYSPSLRDAKYKWNANMLNAWLIQPARSRNWPFDGTCRMGLF